MAKSKNTTKSVVTELNAFLASSYVALVKLHHVHWSVTGPLFKPVHELTQEQYEELFVGIDDLAEQIRQLGEHPVASMVEFVKLSSLKEFSGSPKKAEKMIEELLKDQYTLSEQAKALIQLTGDVGDDATQDLIIARKQVHDKAAWMWEATLG